MTSRWLGQYRLGQYGSGLGLTACLTFFLFFRVTDVTCLYQTLRFPNCMPNCRPDRMPNCRPNCRPDRRPNCRPDRRPNCRPDRRPNCRPTGVLFLRRCRGGELPAGLMVHTTPQARAGHCCNGHAGWLLGCSPTAVERRAC